MLAVVKTPHIDLKIEGEIPPQVLQVLQSTWSNELVLEADDDYVEYSKTEFSKQNRKKMTPGIKVRASRELNGWTQSELGKELGGLSIQNVSDIENGRRAISKKIAEKLSDVFKLPMDYYLRVG